MPSFAPDANEFRCPRCRHALEVSAAGDALLCGPCTQAYSIADAIPDFFVDDEPTSVIRDDDTNRIWLLEEVAAARDVIYTECARKLRGMCFFMGELERWARPGYRILEVGTGTGHFAQWMVQRCGAEIAIYAFDFSWPILRRAQQRTRDLAALRLFRANARGPMPFAPESFDLVFQRLAPFGPRGATSAATALGHLRPGGRYVFAGWEQESDSPEDLLACGYADAGSYRWSYRDQISIDEQIATRIERRHMSAFAENEQNVDEPTGSAEIERREHLLIGIKP